MILGWDESKQFFFEKKAGRPRTKKLLLCWIMGAEMPTP
jgi:hypothetical protein